MENKLEFATEKEIEAYNYRQKGMTYKLIAENMKISQSRAHQLVKSAERRIRRYDEYWESQQIQKAKYSQPIAIALTYGDGILISDLLLSKIKEYEKDFNIRRDYTNPNREANKSKLPYDYFLLTNLYEQLTYTLDIPSFLL